MANDYEVQQNGQEVQKAVTDALHQEKKKKKKKKWIIIAVIVVVIIIIGALASGGSEDTDSASGTTGNEAAVQVDENTTEAGTIGDYVCTVKSAKLTKDYEGKDTVKITYSYTNNSDTAQSFDFALDDNVYQDGIGLEEAYLLSDSDEQYEDNWSVEIKPGVTKEVVKFYKLRDTTTPLEVEVGELISWDDTVVKTTVELSK